MTSRWIAVRILLPTLVLVAGACATDGGYSGSSGGREGIAAGSVEDTSSACLSRIPSDATEGQRMVAEQSCAQEQARRK